MPVGNKVLAKRNSKTVGGNVIGRLFFSFILLFYCFVKRYRFLYFSLT